MALSKAKLVQTLALISLLLLMLAASKVHSTNFNQLPEGYVFFSYDSFNPKPEDLIYTGDAHVVPGSTSLRLTNPGQTRSRGRVLYSKPVPFWEPGTSNQATVFTVLVLNVTPPATDRPLEGFNLLFEPFDDVVGGKLGIFDSASPSSSSGTNCSSSSSIITIVHCDDPDPNRRYVRININPAAARRKSTSDDDDNMLLAGEPITVQFSYLAETTTITASATFCYKTYKESMVLDYLSFFPQHVQVGLQAHTEDAAALYELNSWFFNSWLPFDQNKCVNDKDTYIKQYV